MTEELKKQIKKLLYNYRQMAGAELCELDGTTLTEDINFLEDEIKRITQIVDTF